MSGLYFYKLSSPYQEDVTKNCKLSVNEIDHNFITLKNTDIESFNYDEETGLLILTQKNGEKHITKIDLSGVTKDFNIEWDENTHSLIFKYDNENVVINEFISQIVTDELPNIIGDVLVPNKLDDSLKELGNLTFGVNPLFFTNSYKPVKKIIDFTKGETLPEANSNYKGDRYLTYEIYDYIGKLYDYESITKINGDLENGWRVPNKKDWDDMLNAIELCDADKNHSINVGGTILGRFAGILLKGRDGWDNYVFEDKNNDTDSPLPNPDNVNGTDLYGFNVLPVGYGINFDNLKEYGKECEFWSIDETPSNHVFCKRFVYNKTGVMLSTPSKSTLRSLRLVKDYDGSNFHGSENINGLNYNTVLLPSNCKTGFSIWTSSNVSFSDNKYNPISPKLDENGGQEFVYFINEWDGFKWQRKQLTHGDMLVIEEGPDGYVDSNYQLIKGELVNIRKTFFNDCVEFIDKINVEPILKNGSYIDSVSQNKGVLSATTKQLVKDNDRFLTFNEDGVSSDMDVVYQKEVEDYGERKVYSLVDKYKSLVGNQIIIEKTVGNKTYITEKIPVVGGPLAELINPYVKTVQEGANIQELLKMFLFDEKFPSNIIYNEGDITTTLAQPTFYISKYEENPNIDEKIIKDNDKVEVGTFVNIGQVNLPETKYEITNATWTGFEFGFKKEKDDLNVIEGNPDEIQPTNVEQTSNYTVTRNFVGFNCNNEEINVQNINNNLLDKKLKVSVGDGINSVNVNISGATFNAIFDKIIGYYPCSNMGNAEFMLDETLYNEYIESHVHNKQSELLTNNYSINVNGVRLGFIGAVKDEKFVINSENIRNLSQKVYKNDDDTFTFNLEPGNKTIIIAFPQTWGDLIDVRDVNALNAPMLSNFKKYECDVEGANGYQAVKYNVYMWTSDIILDKINYLIKISKEA